jgi:hypothetical protein
MAGSLPPGPLPMRATLILGEWGLAPRGLEPRATLCARLGLNPQGDLRSRKETTMNRHIVLCALFVATAAALGAQEASQSNPYQGTSNPPPDDTIVTSATPAPKPPAGHPAAIQPAAPAPARSQAEPPPTSVDPALNFPDPGTDDGIVQVAPDAPAQPALSQRAGNYDPDGDIVHPAPPPPGELSEGTTIRVRLLERLSTAYNKSGDAFRTRVASDVLQGGQVLIPAGAEIDGKLVSVSTGHAGGHGSMLLRPETVILPEGSRFRLYAQVAGTPGSRTRVSNEGAITPGSRLKKDGIEYGGAVGAGATTGAILAGPAGALAGTLIGASAITAHLLISHPQATLETGTTLLFSLTEPLDLVPAAPAGN